MSFASASLAPRSASTLRPLLYAGLAIALCCIVAGAKWETIGRFGSAMPDADQWDAEGQHLLVPWFEGGDFLRELFHPHNEHRVVLTKLQALALVLANGQWDARLEAATNALLHAALGAALWLAARSWVASRWHAPLFLVTGLLFALPLGWENTLGGFHSQQYWLLGLSFATIATLPFARPGSAGWWAAAAAAALSLFAMGSGFLAALVVSGVVALRWLRGESGRSDSWPTLLLAGALVAVGAATRVKLPSHDIFHARSVAEFLLYCARSLAWPVRGHDWAGIVLWAPWLATAIQLCRPGADASRNSRAAQTLAALGAWVLLQILATAYARGAGADYPAPRYTDTVAFGATVNAIALARLLSRSSSCWSYGSGLIWLVALATGLAQAADRTLRHEIPDRSRYYRTAETRLRGYLATDDPAQLVRGEIPYPDAAVLKGHLNHRSLRALMPAEVRPPLPLTSAHEDGAFAANLASPLARENAPRAGFSPSTPPLDSLPTWGSFTREGPAAQGEWRSAVVEPRFAGVLKFEMAGQPGAPGVALELHDARSGAKLSSVQPSKTPGETWRAAYVRTPPEPFVVVARDTASDAWLAFSAPVERATLSQLAWDLTRHGRLIALIALGCALLFGALLLTLPRTTATASP